MQRLLRLTTFHHSGLPSLRGPHSRIGSPRGCSTLMTSAPKSPSSAAMSGPASTVATSTTRIPCSGPFAAVDVDFMAHSLGRAATAEEIQNCLTGISAGYSLPPHRVAKGIGPRGFALDLRKLRYFARIVELGSISQAA